MFTGIVEATGTVTAATATPDGRRLRIATDFADLSAGQSVAVDGACLTVEDHGERAGDDGGNAEAADDAATVDRDGGDDPASGDRWFSVFLAAETVDRTTLGDREAGDRVNLERAMPADGRFDGHVVQGHVDGTARVRAVESVGEDWRYEFALPAALSRYVVEKGSIAVDGISLTVADRTEDAFAVAVVPTTHAATTLSERAPGDAVNLEVDVMAKYVERLTQESASTGADPEAGSSSEARR